MKLVGWFKSGENTYSGSLYNHKIAYFIGLLDTVIHHVDMIFQMTHR